MDFNQDMSFRISYWAPLLVFVVISTVLYVRLLILIYKRRKTQQYSSFFYKMFFIGGMFDVLSVVWYVLAQWVYVDQIFGPTFLLTLNYDNIPNLCYYYIYYFLYAQIFIILLVSANRLVAIHFPLSRLLQSCDNFPIIFLFLFTLIFPILITLHFFWQPAIEFRINAAGAVGRWVHPDTTKANAIHAMSVVVISTIFSALCYLSVMRKLAQLNTKNKSDRNHSRKWRQELAITIVGFATFLALCSATAYFSASYVAVMNNNQPLLDTMRSLNIIHYFAMAFVNPWALLITSATMRKSLFWDRSLIVPNRTPVAVPTSRTTDTVPTITSRATVDQIV